MESKKSPTEYDILEATSRARDFSFYCERSLRANPELLQCVALQAPLTVAPLAHRINSTHSTHTVSERLRLLRQQVLCALMIRDLAGWADLSEVTSVMSQLAEYALRAALEQATIELSPRWGQPLDSQGQAMSLHVIGMGKLGGRELNVSSDIDLIFVFPEDGLIAGPQQTTHEEYFSRIARRLMGLLSELTDHGFVFRVDMRLRPYGESGPLVTSFESLENYFITQAREWERYAWIKARLIIGNQPLTLSQLVNPFVFRRHLDYSAFESLSQMKQQIRDELQRRDRQDNIKLGRGGIREIEFIAQVFQLTRGGHDEALRCQPTLDVLTLLEQKNLLPRKAVQDLRDAYRFLRQLEHRLQYRDDQQTHNLPSQAPDIESISQVMGFSRLSHFSQCLELHRQTVAQHFDALLAPPLAHSTHPPLSEQDNTPEPATLDPTLFIGFEDPAELQAMLLRLRDSARYRQMPANSQYRLDRLLPRALRSAARAQNPDLTFKRLVTFFQAIARRESYLALLEQYPQALLKLTDLVDASAWVAQYLTQFPILLDELLITSKPITAEDWPQLAQTLDQSTQFAKSEDLERQMDVLRHFKHAQTLRLIAQDIAGALPLETLSDRLSELAALVLEQVLSNAWNELTHRHCEKAHFAIIAYGKLGGKELGYASDLDLVFLYDDPAPEARDIYIRLAKRITAWLSTTTAAGQLYEIDLRLRPDGISGFLVCSVDQFQHYQMQQAWTWEQQALTRARWVAGDPGIATRFDAIRKQQLTQARPLPALREAIVSMRETMHSAHPNSGTQFDLKHDRGGIVDVEFIVQYLVMGYAHQHPELMDNLGNLALLRLAAQLDLLPQTLTESVINAYRCFRKRQHALRLQDQRYARVDPETVQQETKSVVQLWKIVFGIAH